MHKGKQIQEEEDKEMGGRNERSEWNDRNEKGGKDERSQSLPANVEHMFETFHQSPSGDFKPTFYNPFEVKHRRRTTKAQHKILEKAFAENQKPSAGIRRQLALRLGMTPRAVQVWFQNRRAKLKTCCGSGVLNISASAGTSPDLSRCNSSSDLSLISNNMEVVDSSNFSAQHEPIRSRANSCPNIELPFKQLHDALFGHSASNYQVHGLSNICSTIRPRSSSIVSNYPHSYVQPYPATSACYSNTNSSFYPRSFNSYSQQHIDYTQPHPISFYHQQPIDPTLIQHNDNEEFFHANSAGTLNLDYFSASNPHSPPVMVEPIDINGMMANSESFLMFDDDSQLSLS